MEYELTAQLADKEDLEGGALVTELTKIIQDMGTKSAHQPEIAANLSKVATKLATTATTPARIGTPVGEERFSLGTGIPEDTDVTPSK